MSDIREQIFLAASYQLQRTKRVLIEAATGSGKTKISLDLVKERGYKTVVILVPTDTIAEAWDGEIEKWYGRGKFPGISVNYRSAHKVPALKPDCVILDECHHITELNQVALHELSKAGVDMIGLSATVDNFKFDLLEQIGFRKGIKITIDQAVEGNLIVSYGVSVIQFEMDGCNKTVPAGNKKNRFMTTEADNYAYLEGKLGQAKHNGHRKSIEFAILQRMHFIRSLPSRVEIAKRIIAKIKYDNPERRVLVFAPTMKVAEALVPDCFLHSKSGPKMFDAFKAGKKNMLASVAMLIEGINVQADMILVLSAYSKERATIQQLGRVLRKGADGKEGKMVILCATGTQDEKWVANSTSVLRNVKYYDARKLQLQ